MIVDETVVDVVSTSSVRALTTTVSSAWPTSSLASTLAVAPGVRYRELARRLRAAIASGELPVGARLPPQRDLARALSVGRTTVVATTSPLVLDRDGDIDNALTLLKRAVAVDV